MKTWVSMMLLAVFSLSLVCAPVADPKIKEWGDSDKTYATLLYNGLEWTMFSRELTLKILSSQFSRDYWKDKIYQLDKDLAREQTRRKAWQIAGCSALAAFAGTLVYALVSK